MDELRTLSREEVLSAQDREGEWVECPKWGGRFYVVEFGGRERDTWDQTLFALADDTSRIGLQINRVLRARVVALSVVKGPEDLTPVFDLADIDALSRKNGAELDRLYRVACRLSQLDKGAIEQLVEVLGKALSSGSGVA